MAVLFEGKKITRLSVNYPADKKKKPEIDKLPCKCVLVVCVVLCFVREALSLSCRYVRACSQFRRERLLHRRFLFLFSLVTGVARVFRFGCARDDISPDRQNRKNRLPTGCELDKTARATG